MLTYEALIEQAKTRGMPTDKVRGILREYLQTLILKEIYRTAPGKKLYFTGGTYLRLIHNLKRFSEDLDFNTRDITKAEFEKLILTVSTELRRSGINSEAVFDHWDNIYAGRLIIPDIEKAYNAVSRHAKKEGIVIKIETNRPKWKIKTQTEMIAGFGEMFPCICTDRGALFADKIDALIKKSRGRHLYDIMFMLTNRFPVDKTVLKILGIAGEPAEIIMEKVQRLSKAELQKQAETLRPFLFDESQANLLINAHTAIPSLLEKMQA